MIHSLIKFFTFLGFSSVLFLSATNAYAHPHGWIETRVQIIFNASGKVSAIKHEWLQDEFNSAYNLEGTDKNGDGKPDKGQLKILAAEFMRNLIAENYFLDIKQNGKPIKLMMGQNPQLKLEGLKLNLNFTTALETPVSIQDFPLKYAYYDPSFYIEMLHIEGDKPISLINAPKGCSWVLDPANPDPDIMAFALSLGANESGGNSLGQNFAEWATISCK